MGLFDKIKVTAKNADSKAGEVVDKEKVKSKISEEKKAIEKILDQMGRDYYDAYKAGNDVTADLNALCDEIDAHKEKIAEYEEEIKKIEEEGKKEREQIKADAEAAAKKREEEKAAKEAAKKEASEESSSE